MHPTHVDNTDLTKAEIDACLEHLDVDINLEYDIPYLGGVSTDGETVYIDRTYPYAEYIKYIVLHEVVEGILMRGGLHYQLAHYLAEQMEEKAVLEDGLDLDEYNAKNTAEELRIYEKPIVSVPPDLDITPYRDEAESAVLTEMHNVQPRLSDSDINGWFTDNGIDLHVNGTSITTR